MGALGGLRKEEYPGVWQQSVQILHNLGNQEVRLALRESVSKLLTPSHFPSIFYIAIHGLLGVYNTQLKGFKRKAS